MQYSLPASRHLSELNFVPGFPLLLQQLDSDYEPTGQGWIFN